MSEGTGGGGSAELVRGKQRVWSGRAGFQQILPQTGAGRRYPCWRSAV